MTAVLLTASEASLVRDALGRECETCRGRGVQPWQPGELPGGGYCPKCNGSGIHPSPVHIVVEGDFHCDIDLPTQAVIRNRWEPPARWPDGERVVLTVETWRRPKLHHDHMSPDEPCPGVTTVPLASATVRVEERDQHHWLVTLSDLRPA